MPDAPTTEFWRDLEPIDEGLPARRAAGGVHHQRPHRRRALLRADHRDGRPSRPLWISPTQNKWCRHPDGEGGRAGQPPLPPARGLRLHDLGQVGLPRARLDRDRRATSSTRRRARATRSSPTSIREPMRVLLHRQGPARSGSTRTASRSATSTCTTTSPCARSTTRRSASAPTPWRRCSARQEVWQASPIIRHATPADGASCAEIYLPSVREGVASLEDVPPDAEEMTSRIQDDLADAPVAGGRARRRDGRVRLREPPPQPLGLPLGHRRDGVRVRAPQAPGAWRAGCTSGCFELVCATGLHGWRAPGSTLPNEASVGLHEAFGFEPVGVYRKVGVEARRVARRGLVAARAAAHGPPRAPGRAERAARGELGRRRHGSVERDRRGHRAAAGARAGCPDRARGAPRGPPARAGRVARRPGDLRGGGPDRSGRPGGGRGARPRAARPARPAREQRRRRLAGALRGRRPRQRRADDAAQLPRAGAAHGGAPAPAARVGAERDRERDERLGPRGAGRVRGLLGEQVRALRLVRRAQPRGGPERGARRAGAAGVHRRPRASRRPSCGRAADPLDGVHPRQGGRGDPGRGAGRAGGALRAPPYALAAFCPAGWRPRLYRRLMGGGAGSAFTTRTGAERAPTSAGPTRGGS